MILTGGMEQNAAYSSYYYPLVQNGHDFMVRNGVGPGDVFVHHMPMFHTTGCALLALGSVGGSRKNSWFFLTAANFILTTKAIRRSSCAEGGPAALRTVETRHQGAVRRLASDEQGLDLASRGVSRLRNALWRVERQASRRQWRRGRR